jgi:hypothetical protein
VSIASATVPNQIREDLMACVPTQNVQVPSPATARLMSVDCVLPPVTSTNSRCWSRS